MTLTPQELYERAIGLIEAGKIDEAINTFISLLRKEKSAATYTELGKLYLKNNKPDNALECFEQAISIDASYHRAYACAGDLFLQEGLGLQALDSYIRAVNACPESVAYKDTFVAIASNFQFKVFMPGLKATLHNCLETPHVDMTNISSTILSIFFIDPVFRNAASLIGFKGGDYNAFVKAIMKFNDFSAFLDPFFLLVLKRIRILDVDFESFLTNLRRFLLDNVETPGVFGHPDLYIRLANALGIYCYNTDYVLIVTDDEKKSLYPLQSTVEKTVSFGPMNTHRLALLACFVPLNTLANADAILTHAPNTVSDLISLHITDFFRRKSIEKSIPVIALVSDSVSKKVQEQYEQSPYPRWTDFSKRIYSEQIEGSLRSRGANILVAGCGTGREAIELATVFPDSNILAVDLSRASLSYGIDKAHELGITNICFMQADILSLNCVDKHFDLIASSGVLHHMQDPLQGWRVLRSLLVKGGLMRIGLYSRTAHAPIIEAQKMISKYKLTSGPDDIRFFRKNLRSWVSKKSYAALTNMIDYYALSECRDMFFHVQESRVDPEQIKDILSSLELSFLGFSLPETILSKYRKENPSDPLCRNLSLWRSFEARHPLTFRSMYNFWCQA